MGGPKGADMKTSRRFIYLPGGLLYFNPRQSQIFCAEGTESVRFFEKFAELVGEEFAAGSDFLFVI